MLPCTYVESILARHAAPCLAGIKPANLVAFASADVQWCSIYNALLNTHGIFFIPLCVSGNRAQILVYRKALLGCFCFEPETAAVLRSFGYKPEWGIDAILLHLQNRMAFFVSQQGKQYKDLFPHEIGLFLGYPVEDVVQYVQTGGQNCLFCGYWKVYSNPERARQQFHRYTECKERFALQIKSGMTICEIVRAA